jgi:hypothetical protein
MYDEFFAVVERGKLGDETCCLVMERWVESFRNECARKEEGDGWKRVKGRRKKKRTEKLRSFFASVGVVSCTKRS